ncbi:MAG: FAD-dependent oxidoreductase, partial [Actinomycetota bacterium]|nr:FAD-dependent oxidoreductase [Actinomycetota bacterium]
IWPHFDADRGLKAFSDNNFRCVLDGRSLPLFALARLGLPPWMIVPTLTTASPPVLGSPARWLSDLPAAARRIGVAWLGQEWAADPVGFDVPEMLEIARATGALGGEAVVVAGWDGLPEQLAAGLDVRISCPARRLTLHDDGVVIETESGAVRAAAAVVTVPPWTVGNGRLELDGLPGDKRYSAASLRGGDAVVAIVSISIVAPESVSVFDGDHGYGFLRAQQGSGDIQIVAKGAGAQRLRSLLAWTVSGVDEPRVAGAELSALLAAALPWSTGAEISTVTVADWGADPFISGAFTSPTPGRSAHSAIWARPWAERVFFAGESTSPARGVGRVHGALASGLRAATELLATCPTLLANCLSPRLLANCLSPRLLANCTVRASAPTLPNVEAER